MAITISALYNKVDMSDENGTNALEVVVEGSPDVAR